MLFAEERELVYSSIVLALETSVLKPILVQDLEAKFKGTVEAGGGVMGPEGGGALIRVPRKHLEITIMRNRWEIISRRDVVDGAVATNVANAAHILASYAESLNCKAIGYNYNMVFNAADGDTAIKAIAAKTLNERQLNQGLGYLLVGAAVWLYLDIEGKTLWLRLEPRGGDRDSRKIWAYANFTQELQGGLPPETQLTSEFLHLNEILGEVLKRL